MKIILKDYYSCVSIYCINMLKFINNKKAATIVFFHHITLKISTLQRC